MSKLQHLLIEPTKTRKWYPAAYKAVTSTKTVPREPWIENLGYEKIELGESLDS